MSMRPNRRQFLQEALGTTVGLGLASQSSGSTPDTPTGRPKKSVMYSMLPESLSVEERFRLAKAVGFEGVECSPVADEAAAKALRAAAEKAGIPIQSIIHGGWDNPLTSADPAVIARGIENAQHAMQCAKWMGADDILLVPGIVTPEIRYQDAYTRSQKNIRTLIPMAERLGVMVLIEEVWNKFLLSPLEFAHYIDAFRHPLVQAYFDVGNVVIWGYPEDWIRTLGKRIKKVHLKDFKRGSYQFVNLRDGDVNWPEVRRAFAEVGFTGFMNTELGGGDEAYLRDVSARVDKILAGV